jgi:hypothetical protein
MKVPPSVPSAVPDEADDQVAALITCSALAGVAEPRRTIEPTSAVRIATCLLDWPITFQRFLAVTRALEPEQTGPWGRWSAGNAVGWSATISLAMTDAEPKAKNQFLGNIFAESNYLTLPIMLRPVNPILFNFTVERYAKLLKVSLVLRVMAQDCASIYVVLLKDSVKQRRCMISGWVPWRKSAPSPAG